MPDKPESLSDKHDGYDQRCERCEVDWCSRCDSACPNIHHDCLATIDALRAQLAAKTQNMWFAALAAKEWQKRAEDAEAQAARYREALEEIQSRLIYTVPFKPDLLLEEALQIAAIALASAKRAGIGVKSASGEVKDA